MVDVVRSSADRRHQNVAYWPEADRLGERHHPFFGISVRPRIELLKN